MSNYDSLFDQIKAFSDFWKKHLYCLPDNCIEKGIRFLSTCSKVFRLKYTQEHLTKILNAFCTFEKRIQAESCITPQKRGILFRLFKTRVIGNSTLGIAIVLKIKASTEFLSKDHLLRAILHILPGVVPTAHTNYHFHDELSGLLFIYQEIEKKRGRGFLISDIQQLKRFLKKELEESIESLTPSLCLIRNEEEIFRNIVQMGRELNRPKDLPQVTISFQEHTPRGFLRFSVVVVRVIGVHSPSLRDLSLSLPQTIRFIPEMTSEIGKLDKELSKEANIVTFEVESSCFARKNGSIDLREARSYIAKSVELMISDFRDYNGGLLSKQNKHLKEIQESLGDGNHILLESLFYSFTPSLFQTFILPEAGKACATFFLEAQKQQLSPQKTYAIFKHTESNFSLIVIKTGSEQLKTAVLKEVSNFSLPLHQFGYTIQNIDGEYYIGLIYQYPSDLSLFDSVQSLFQKAFWDLHPPESRFLRINFQDGDPLSLNPQLGLDLRCRSVQKALFEGLTRISAVGTAQLAAAKSVEILDNGRVFLFSLRKLQWSNGEELSASQFEKSWKKAIKSPACLRPDIFYFLKNARKARQGAASLEDIGVKALDKRTLKVTLEYPVPRFLEMLSHPLFFPLYEESGEPYVFSGPFTLHSWTRDERLSLIKNPYYWDFENVKLDGIEIFIIRDPALAYHKYKNGELDWIGGPFSLLPTSIAETLQGELQKVETPGVSWLYCNLSHPLFSSAKIRRALSFALDRKKICEKTLIQQTPLKTLLPKGLSLLNESEILQEEKNYAEIFKKNLQEIREQFKKLEPLTLYHSHIPGQKELAAEVQSQWKEVFGLKMERVEKPWNTFSHQLDNRLFHFGSCYRHPFYYDPMYFFQIFYDPSNIHNAFGWHSKFFNHCIDQACSFPEDKSYLKLAELELTRQMPVIPLHMVTYHHLSRREIKGIRLGHSGDVDFRWMSFEEKG